MEATIVTNSNGSSKKVSGVNLALVKRDALVDAGTKLQAFESLKGPPANASTEALVKALSEHFKAKHSAEELMACDCGGVSPETLDACPFCGDAATTAGPAGNVAKPAESKIESVAPAAPEKEPEAHVAARKKTKDGDKAKAAKSEGKEKPKGEEKVLMKVTPIPQTKIIPARVVGDKAMTEKDLDHAVKEVQDLKTKGATNYWDLGAKIKEIYDKQLYKLRSVDGKPAYKGFEAFCAKELGLTASNAYAMRDVASKYTRDEVMKFGSSKLALVLTAPDSKQPEIQKRIEAGASFRDVKEDVRKARETDGVPTKERHRKQGGARPDTKKQLAQNKPDASKPERVTVAGVAGRQRIKLYKKGPKGADPVRAKRLADMPWGSFESTNGVKFEFAITEDAAGELVLLMNMHRPG